jgi:hypothetical protein
VSKLDWEKARPKSGARPMQRARGKLTAGQKLRNQREEERRRSESYGRERELEAGSQPAQERV